MEQNHIIYGLVDPRDPQIIRYIGRSYHMGNRYKDHVKRFYDIPRCRWIRSLLDEGLKPLVVTIQDNVPEALSPHLEVYWISYYDRLLGDLLLNSDSGGEGTWSHETRKKISVGGLASVTDKRRRGHSSHLSGRWNDPEGRKILMKAMTSPEYKEAQRRASKITWQDPDYRDNQSRKARINMRLRYLSSRNLPSFEGKVAYLMKGLW